MQNLVTTSQDLAFRQAFQLRVCHLVYNNCAICFRAHVLKFDIVLLLLRAEGYARKTNITVAVYIILGQDFSFSLLHRYYLRFICAVPVGQP